jgi:hypothetical protein
MKQPLFVTRPVVPEAEAARYAEGVISDHLEDHPDVASEGTTGLGLFTWTPDPWSTAVDDVGRPYYFWVYTWLRVREYRGEVDGGMHRLEETMYLTVGRTTKGGNHVGADHPGVFVDSFWDDKDDAMSGLALTTAKDLEKEGLAGIEILATLAGGG